MSDKKFFLHNEFGGFSNSILVNKTHDGQTVIKVVEDGRPWNIFVLNDQEKQDLIKFLTDNA